MQRCVQTNGNGVQCQRRTSQWLDWVPLCDAHYRQALQRRPVPIELIQEGFGDWAVANWRHLADDIRRPADVASHASRRPTMGEVQAGWVLDLGSVYGWAVVTKVEHLQPPVDGIPRVRVHFLTDSDQRPQHTLPAAEPCYPYRRPTQAGAA